MPDTTSGDIYLPPQPAQGKPGAWMRLLLLLLQLAELASTARQRAKSRRS